MKKFLTTIAACLGLIGFSSAATITLVNSTGTKYFTSTGSQLPEGTLLRIGYFVSGTSVATISSNDFAEVNAAFIPLGTGGGLGTYVTGQNTANSSGTFVDTNSQAPKIDGILLGSGPGLAPGGVAIYVFISTPDQKEWSISRDTAAASVYKVPAVETGTSSAVSPSPATVGSAAEVFHGSYVAGSPNEIRMGVGAAIPEPSVMPLMALCAIIGFRRRRLHNG